MENEAVVAAERKAELAMARLGVAEDLRWYLAFFIAASVYSKWDTLIGAAIAYLIAIFVVPYWYDKEYIAANDDLERITRTGKYFRSES